MIEENINEKEEYPIKCSCGTHLFKKDIVQK